MSDILDKIKKARQSKVEIDGVTFVFQRPTEMDTLDMRYEGVSDAVKGVAEFVTGWSGVRELDMFPGGTNKEVQFDKEVMIEFIKDRSEMWAPLVEAVRNSYSEFSKKRKAAEKK